MKHYPTEIEFVDEGKELIAKLKLFEDASWQLTIQDRLISPDDLRYIADVLEENMG